ncbi:DUF3560 domain-containing protein [Chitinophaga niastensis]|nr:DUF3560 domain-containing protein [Chitinophaga niastensis]
MKHNYEERKQNRILYAATMAGKKNQESDTLYNKAKSMASVIPFGQPILVGHHSEIRDRRYRAGIHNTFGKAFKAMDTAKYYEEKAETIEHNNAISSDDPTAIEKLQEKLHATEKRHAFMKAANKAVKKKDKEGFMKLEGATEPLWNQLLVDGGFAWYALPYATRDIKALKKRIAELQEKEQQGDQEAMINGIRVFANVTANRLQLIYPGKPDYNYRKNVLKKNGFIWCGSEGAWQRKLNGNAKYAARTVLALPITYE